MKKAQPPKETGPCLRETRDSQRPDVLCLQALGATGHVELHLLALLQSAEALSLNRSVVAEEILAPAVLRDEPKALRVVEPLHGTSCHYSSAFFLVRPQEEEPLVHPDRALPPAMCHGSRLLPSRAHPFSSALRTGWPGLNTQGGGTIPRSAHFSRPPCPYDGAAPPAAPFP